MARSIFVTALAALSFLFFGVYALQYQSETTAASLPDAANATNGTYPAWNSTQAVYPDLGVVLGTYLPLAFGAVVVVFVLVMAYLAAGGR